MVRREPLVADFFGFQSGCTRLGKADVRDPSRSWKTDVEVRKPFFLDGRLSGSNSSAVIRAGVFEQKLANGKVV